MAVQNGAYKVALTAATTTAVGGVLSVVNPTGVDLMITRLLLNVTTQSSGAAAVDIGVDDGGDVNSDTLIDGLSVATAGLYDNIENQGTNGKSAVRWPAGHYLVGTASATTAGMVGYAYIEWTYV